MAAELAPTPVAVPSDLADDDLIHWVCLRYRVRFCGLPAEVDDTIVAVDDSEVGCIVCADLHASSWPRRLCPRDGQLCTCESG